MKDNKSYEKYKQYRHNKYRYEREQIIFPIAVVLIIATYICLRKYIIATTAIACAIAGICLFIYLCLKKQIIGQPIVLTEEQAIDGVNATVNVSYKDSRATVCLDIPANVKDGEKFIIKNVFFEDANGKSVRKNVRLIVKIS